MPFDPKKPVALRDGTAARIVTTIKATTFPLLAIVTNEDGSEYAETYTMEGKVAECGGANDRDLVNVPEKATFFLNFSRTGSVYKHFSKEAAIEAASEVGRYAAIGIEVTYEVLQIVK